MEKMPDEKYRLEIKHRNPIHALMMKKMLGTRVRDHFAQEAWAAEYGKKISEILDTPEHENIRELARAGKYEEAAEIILDLLPEEE